MSFGDILRPISINVGKNNRVRRNFKDWYFTFKSEKQCPLCHIKILTVSSNLAWEKILLANKSASSQVTLSVILVVYYERYEI